MTTTKPARAAHRRIARALTVLILTPMISFAIGGVGSTASPWSVEIVSVSGSDLTVTIAGTAFSPAGQASGNYLEIEWGDGSVETLPNFVGKGPWAWGPRSHTYAEGGSFTITATLLHASRNGNDRNATDSVVVVVPDPEDPEDPEEPDEAEVDVQVELGRCTSDGSSSSTPLNVTFTGDGDASVVVRDAGDDVVATFTGSGSESLAPGTYTYVVTPEEGSELEESSDTEGGLVVGDCTPDVAGQGSVSVSLGACDSASGDSLTPLGIVIAPTGAATVVLSQGATVIETFDGSGGAIDLQHGDYVWTAVPGEGFQLTGPTAGSLVAEDCPSIVLGGPPQAQPDAPELPKALAKTGPSLPAALALAFVLAVAGAWITVVQGRLGAARG